METTMSRLLIEATVRQTLKGLQEDPKRSVRNILDMALQFSRGRFQSRFFETARTMLENENSAYYTLVQDAAAHIETEHLVRFGMNLGYNSCTWGARRIRANEEKLGFNIPWAVTIKSSPRGRAWASMPGCSLPGKWPPRNCCRCWPNIPTARSSCSARPAGWMPVLPRPPTVCTT